MKNEKYKVHLKPKFIYLFLISFYILFLISSDLPFILKLMIYPAFFYKMNFPFIIIFQNFLALI